ncbi:hypothetical protein HGI79_16885 [Clostridium sp. DJ247]|nr:hypothetical protein [Clostridium sp. DJ247]MBC2581924.1 hypothetical protein [Clostridium sp. DJ247]
MRICITIRRCRQNGKRKVDKTPVNSDAQGFINQYFKDTEAKKADYVGKYVLWQGTVNEVSPYVATEKKDKKENSDVNCITFTIGYLR